MNSEWQPISTVPRGQVVLAWEPMYGWLLACYHGDRWELKSSGNFWMECPDSVEFTHWMKLPRGPSALNEQEKG